MTTATDEFMARLGKLDIKLWMEGEKLRCNAPNQVMTPELKTELSARKAEIIDFLKKTETGLKTSIPTVSRNQILPLSYNQSRLRA
ncbi:MAG: TubC N-terminal docking domain-related protein, partial [Gammaproteobacteria bacterium]